MATITRTIGPGGGPTYDYATLSAWQAGEQTNLVDAGDTHVAECYTFPGGLDDAVNIQSWITNASNYITVTVASGAEHNGIPGAGFYLNNDSTWQIVYQCQQDYTRTIGIEVRSNRTSTSPFRLDAPDQVIDSCLIKNAHTNTPALELYRDAALRNSLIYDSAQDGISAPAWQGGVTVENCNVTNAAGVGLFVASESTFTVKNTVCYNCASDFEKHPDGNWGAGSDYNATSQATDANLPNSGSGNNVTSVASSDFADEANNDFHLSGASSKLYGAGVDLSLDFTDDWEGDTRVQWDIGADEFVGGPPTPIEIDINDVLHARPVDEVDVTEVITIVPIDINALRHGRRVDSVVLGVSVDLFVAAMRHGRAVDEVALEVSVDLTIDALRHRRVVDVVAVQELVGVLIDITDQRHRRPVDSLLLAVDQPILIDAMRHGRPVDTVGVQPLLGDQTGIGATASNWILDAGQPLNNASSVDFDYHVLEGIFDSDQSVLGVDGSRVTGPAGMRELTVLTLGANVDGQERVQGEIAELRIYAGALSQADRDRILQELTAKWITG